MEAQKSREKYVKKKVCKKTRNNEKVCKEENGTMFKETRSKVYGRVEVDRLPKVAVVYAALRLGKMAAERGRVVESVGLLKRLWIEAVRREDELFEEIDREWSEWWDLEDENSSIYYRSERTARRRIECAVSMFPDRTVDRGVMVERTIPEEVSIDTQGVRMVIEDAHREARSSVVLVVSPKTDRYLVDMDGFVPEDGGIDGCLFMDLLSGVSGDFADIDSEDVTAFEATLLEECDIVPIK